MVQIKKTHAVLAAEAILADIAFDDHRIDEKLEALFSLERLPENLAFLTQVVFDRWDAFPYISAGVGDHLGIEAKIRYGTAMHEIDRARKRCGDKAIPLTFVDEEGNQHNVVFMADYQHLRKSAA